jgi:hypothetical protein
MKSFLVIVALLIALFLGTAHEFVALNRIRAEFTVAKEHADTEMGLAGANIYLMMKDHGPFPTPTPSPNQEQHL